MEVEMAKPIIAIPLGDPAGIGPEIVVKTLATKEVFDWCNPVVVGTKEVLENAVKICGLDLVLVDSSDLKSDDYSFGKIHVVNVDCISLSDFELGKVNEKAGQAAFQYIAKATELAMQKKVDALATTPINKESLRAGDVNYIGHTEMLESLTNSTEPLTMFEVRGMRVFFLTRHLSLRAACDAITKQKVLDHIIRCTEALKQLGVEEGTMAVAGLNPHCGEHGLFGDEEVNHIEPAVIEAQQMGIKVVGPIGADSVFHMALQGRFSSVLSLYHDQGHIATKTLDFERTISITNGLPFLRTSVDHGTAFDIAGKNIASEVSMVEAVRLAAQYATKFRPLV